MNRLLLPQRLRALLATSLVAFVVHAAAQAPPKPVTKAPPRLPPNASETSRIPAGVDTGSPATSDALPLGTPVPPALSADRNELKTRSAAARAAARPKPASSAAWGPRDTDRTAGRAGPSTAPAASGAARPPASPPLQVGR